MVGRSMGVLYEDAQRAIMLRDLEGWETLRHGLTSADYVLDPFVKPALQLRLPLEYVEVVVSARAPLLHLAAWSASFTLRSNIEEPSRVLFQRMIATAPEEAFGAMDSDGRTLLAAVLKQGVGHHEATLIIDRMTSEQLMLFVGNEEKTVLDGLIASPGDELIRQILSKLEPEACMQQDSRGNTILHRVAMRGKPVWQVGGIDVAARLLEICPEAALIENNEGLVPLAAALRSTGVNVSFDIRDARGRKKLEVFECLLVHAHQNHFTEEKVFSDARGLQAMRHLCDEDSEDCTAAWRYLIGLISRPTVEKRCQALGCTPESIGCKILLPSNSLGVAFFDHLLVLFSEDFDVTRVDSDGNTALHLAVAGYRIFKSHWESNFAMTEWLLPRVPQNILSQPNNSGLTPLHIAVSESCFSLAAIVAAACPKEALCVRTPAGYLAVELMKKRALPQPEWEPSHFALHAMLEPENSDAA